MKQRRKHRELSQRKDVLPDKPSPTLTDSALGGKALPAREWLLAVITALFVARPLVPSEGVAWLGDGQPFCMLWLLAAVGTALAAVKGGSFPRRFGVCEMLLGAFVLLYAGAALRGSSLGGPRPAINMLWETIAMAISFLLARQLIGTAREERALAAVMLALAVVLSSYGYYQVFVGMPADRAEYAQDPDGMLRRAGQWYAPGSPERAAFENRLDSTEPLATFALTNSLAGFLLIWLVVGLGLQFGPLSSRQRLAIATISILIAGCLVLTKSRSALASLVLTLPILFASFRLSAKQLKYTVGIVVVGVAIVALATMIGGLDAKVISEAGKSLGYRLQYWQSSILMIRDWPLLGVGPGNFQDFYTEYKLPQASEEIRDPHNWFIEIAATAGVPALVAAVSFLAFSFWQILRRPTSLQGANAASTNCEWFIYGGATMGFLIALIVGPLAGLPFGFEKLASGIIVSSICILGMQSWIANGNLSPKAIAIAVGALLVHLAASGGFFFPGVAGSLWLLLAMGLNQTEPLRAPAGKAVPVIAFVTLAVLAIAQYLTGYSPVLRSQGAMMMAQELVDDPAAQERALLLAAEHDPRSADPWQELAALKLRRWLAQPGTRSLKEFRDACDFYLSRKPRSSSAHRMAGNWWRQIFDRSPSAISAEESVNHLSRAVELYPNLSILRAELALAYDTAGEPDKAAVEAQRSLELDQATPHLDKRLPAEIRQKIAIIAGKEAAGSR